MEGCCTSIAQRRDRGLCEGGALVMRVQGCACGTLVRTELALNVKNILRRASRLARRLPGAQAWRTAMSRRRARREFQAHFAHVINLAARLVAAQPVQEAASISLVVPVFNAPPSFLDDLLLSFRNQNVASAELVLSDDGSSAPATLAWLDRHKNDSQVVVLRALRNGGIASATNAGIARATGEWVGLLDQDDALTPHALRVISHALAHAPQCQFLYTDEVIANNSLQPCDYFLKPAFDAVLLSGVNYINHLSLYRADRLKSINGLRDGFQGSQDHELLLRYTRGLQPAEILHVPYPAYIWRRTLQSHSARFMAQAAANAREALAQHYGTSDGAMPVGPALSADLHRVRFDLARKTWPLVSIVIPSRDSFALISRLLAGLTSGTDYPCMDIIVIDNGSVEAGVLALYEQTAKSFAGFHAHVQAQPFNFSRAVNKGLALARGEAILLLNNDVEVLEPNWLREMVSCLDYPGTGIVGAKLLYPDRTIQHAGVIAGLGGLAGHWHSGSRENFPGPMGRLLVRQSFSIVTGACLLMTRDCAAAVGDFDEEIFPVAYNDVDFCLRAIALGFNVVWTPFACLMHHESASRGSDTTAENIGRFQRDKDNLRLRHRTDIFEDRAYNPWYDKSHSQPHLARLAALPKPRS